MRRITNPMEIQYFILTVSFLISVVPLFSLKMIYKKISYKWLIPLSAIYLVILLFMLYPLMWIFKVKGDFQYYILTITLSAFLTVIALLLLRKKILSKALKAIIITVLITNILIALNHYIFYHPNGIERTFKYCESSIICLR
jgi:hypothetical protein